MSKVVDEEINYNYINFSDIKVGFCSIRLSSMPKEHLRPQTSVTLPFIKAVTQ